MSMPSRNQPCPCGSGRRYKECHGKVADAAALSPHSSKQAECRRLMNEALALQQARKLGEAEEAYRRVLAIVPDEPDALHMLGVIRYERGDLEGARKLMVHALDLTGWRIVAIRQNLGLVLSKLNPGQDAAAVERLRSRYGDFLATRRTPSGASNPLVSVIIPSHNHGHFVEQALRSVYEQTYRNLEIIVIDDGSTDGSTTLIREALRHSPFPERFLARENRGAPSTLNQGIELASGAYVQFLNSDDWLTPERIASMVAMVSDARGGWGFSAVAIHDGDGLAVDPMRNRRAYDLMCSTATIPFHETVGLAFVTQNVAVSTGNLFAAIPVVRELGGFREFRYNHDWDFCLRALQRSEPVFVPEPLYCYRLHGANTINESAERARAEAQAICADYLTWASSEDNPLNPFAPASATLGSLFLNTILNGGMGGLVDPDSMRKLALADRRVGRI